ncbi:MULTISPECIES: alpha/beta fold hydrolase [unclassified Mucilaginibacter]|uniref:alpha/beta hydrolase n=1 Tax=unclassified Mucilaginibacter TaxID=2617802 RepID=UPI002AC929DE|nr:MULTISPECIES: alpha/beta fold hydrolase [unclassified Mucilaginibacter]MEB0262851.1 alpha/beta fold hydrolase [Mucilaginibacter sp. 10I4]MEB0277690.1 alpha/beta fold hydrolase [Mucilaginibacter sp. 10B2]MEB0301949.1 alpha/beta fold hydrolase [Mucilaginibacter sp. 5C4]WPX24683.1 alpha/beta fold hydrolase [Mucilaginibacter sp. 5C4]
MIIKQHYTIPGAKGRGMTADINYNTLHPYAPLVIFAHGIRGFKDWGAHNLVANYFAENGFRFLKFNFSHNGTTADKPTEFADLIAFSDNTFSLELEDLKSVIDFACGGSAIPRVKSVYVIGHSLGGGISIVKTAEDKRIAKLVTMAAISSFHNLWPKEAEKQWRLQGIMYMKNSRTGQNMPYKSSLLKDLDDNPVRLDIPLRASEITQPWLIIHGDADTSVPLSHAELLHVAQPLAGLLVIPTADHVFNASEPYQPTELPTQLLAFCDAAINFFKI